MKRLFKGAEIVTVNENFDIITNGMLGVKNNEIAYVGEYSLDFEKEFDADSVIHAHNKIIMPGLVNTHTHVPMTLLRGYGTDLPLDRWLNEKILPAEAKMTAEDVRLGAQIGIMEMLLSGTTCFSDMYFYEETIADIALEMGIRAVLSNGIVASDSEDKYTSLNKYVFELGDNKIKTMAGIHTEYTNTEETIKKVIAIAKESSKKIHIHIAETYKEVDDCIKRTGMTPVKYLESLGLFDVGVIAVHCVALSDEDIEIFKKYNVSIVYCPSSNMKLASGFAPINKIIDAGINVALGTDGAASNNNLDMLEEMHVGSLAVKCAANNPASMNAESTIKMATINGAKAFGMEHLIGSLETGKRADIIMINNKSPFMIPKAGTCNNIVYSASRNEIEMTMIDGKVLMERGNLLNIKLEDIVDKFEQSFAALT